MYPPPIPKVGSDVGSCTVPVTTLPFVEIWRNLVKSPAPENPAPTFISSVVTFANWTSAVIATDCGIDISPLLIVIPVPAEKWARVSAADGPV